MSAFTDDPCQGCADFGRRNHHMDSGCGHGLHLVGGGALAAADDGAGMAHAAAWGRGLPSDEAYYRLLHMLLDELGGGFFGGTAYFANEDDGFGFQVVVEEAQRIDVRGADDGVATDSNRG